MINNFMYFVPFLVQLSEKEKKTVGIVAAILLFVLLLFGLLAKLILAIKAKKGLEVDAYMTNLVKYGVIKNPSEFKSYVYKRESRRLYLTTRWFIRIAILVVVGLILYINLKLDGDFNVLLDIFKNFFPKYEIPKAEIFGLNIPANWPQLIKAPEITLTLDGYVTYLTMILALIIIVKLICSAFVFYSRLERSNKVASKAFGTNLENGVGGNNNGLFGK